MLALLECNSITIIILIIIVTFLWLLWTPLGHTLKCPDSRGVFSSEVVLYIKARTFGTLEGFLISECLFPSVLIREVPLYSALYKLQTNKTMKIKYAFNVRMLIVVYILLGDYSWWLVWWLVWWWSRQSSCFFVD